jgi:hypothetical protein
MSQQRELKMSNEKQRQQHDESRTSTKRWRKAKIKDIQSRKVMWTRTRREALSRALSAPADRLMELVLFNNYVHARRVGGLATK